MIAPGDNLSIGLFAPCLMYALTKEAGELEANEWFKSYLKGRRKEEIYANFNEALMVVQEKPVPDWDR